MTTPLNTNQRPKLLYFIGVDWFFLSHFLDRAVAAQQYGFDVVVLTKITGDLSAFKHHGIKVVHIEFARRSIHPKYLIPNLKKIIEVFRQENPDIIQQVALKPILLGSIAARWLGIQRIVNAVVGMGFAYTSNTRLNSIIRRLLSILFYLILDKRNAKFVFENADDMSFFLSKGWVTKCGATLIRGAGVDVQQFQPSALQADPPIVVLLSRMLWDKGIQEFVEAARIIKRKNATCQVRFVLVGDTDDDNRGSIPREVLLSWQAEGAIEWWGFRSDVANVLGQSTISCLPSYREGLPKSLLESLAVGLPCVATDVPGCREAVKHGVNGFLVPPKDPKNLAAAIDALLGNAQLIKQFGLASRKMAENVFSTTLVNHQTIILYQQLLNASKEPSN